MAFYRSAFWNGAIVQHEHAFVVQLIRPAWWISHTADSGYFDVSEWERKLCGQATTGATALRRPGSKII
jgi:hypothetical protein